MQHHGAGLRRLTGDDELVDALLKDYRTADLSGPNQAMLDYVAVLTREPWTVERSHIDALRQAGFDDRAILDICQIAAYYAYVNRTADGLGVELET